MELRIKKLHPEAILPKYQTAGAACFDLHACLPYYGVCFTAGTSDTIRTGLAFEIQQGHVMLIFSRSGHGFKDNVRLSNCVGVIDADYRGEVYVKLAKDEQGHHDSSVFDVRHGDRIAQAMIIPVQQVQLVEVDELSGTDRGTGGFGSTGK